MTTFNFTTKGYTAAGPATYCHQMESYSLMAMVLQVLQSSSPLTELALELGQLFKTDACLLLQVRPNQEAMTCVLWHPPEPPEVLLTPRNFSHSDSLANQGIDRFLANATAHQPYETFDWLALLPTLLSNASTGQGWLHEMGSYLPIPVRTAEGWLGMALLMSTSDDFGRRNEASLIEAVKDSLSLVFQYCLQQQQGQLYQQETQHLRQLKEDFISTLNHELRTPLTSMMLAIRMLHRPDLTPDRAAMYLDILEQQCTREINLVNDLLMLQAAEAASQASCQPSLAREMLPVRLQEILTAAIESKRASFVAANRHLQLEMAKPQLLVMADANHLHRVLHELLTNAMKFSDSGTTIVVTVDSDARLSQSVFIRVANVGDGIMAEEIPFMFDKFRRGRTATRNAIPGTGLGLALVWGLVKQMGGSVTISSQPTLAAGQWQTCFTLELPQAPVMELVAG